MRVTVLILSVDEAPMLERSLPAVMAQEPAAAVVVSDNACTDATAQLAGRHGAERIALSPRRSYAEAINRGSPRPAVMLCCCSTPTACCAPAFSPRPFRI